jgi:hypothetical protein
MGRAFGYFFTLMTLTSDNTQLRETLRVVIFPFDFQLKGREREIFTQSFVSRLGKSTCFPLGFFLISVW